MSRFWMPLALAAMSLALMTSCGGSGEGAGHDEVGSGCATVSDGPSGAAAAGSLTVDGEDRTFRLYLPEVEEPVGLIVDLHSADDDADGQAELSGIEEPAAAAGFATVHPEARFGVWDLESGTDVEFVGALVDCLTAEVPIEPGAVFAAGMSQGGDFASLLSCRLPGRFEAVAVVGVFNHHRECAEPVAMPVVGFVGRNDPIYVLEEGLSTDVPFTGNPAARPGPLAEETGSWAEANGCRPEPQVATDDAGVDTLEFDCPAAAEVVYVHPGGHAWPGRPQPAGAEEVLGPAFLGLDANATMIRFFRAQG